MPVPGHYIFTLNFITHLQAMACKRYRSFVTFLLSNFLTKLKISTDQELI